MSSAPRKRCPIHDTVLSPQGGCVLCRSRAPAKQAQRWGWIVLSLVVAFVAVGVIVKLRLYDRWPEANPTDAVAGAAHLDATSVEGQLSASVVVSSAPSAKSRESGAGGAGSLTLGKTEHAAFSERDPRGFIAELRARGERELTGDYQAKNETYELVLPASAAHDEPMGLLIWISASPSGALPNPNWAKTLDSHRLAWIGPNRAGNDREIAIRLGLALDSVLAARRRLNLDPNRLFIGGISGGAKTAFRALLYYPELFRGALLAAGIEYIRDVPIHSKPGSYWPQRIGTPSDLNAARARPIAITTGPRDFNYGQIHDVVAALGQDRFSHVIIFDWPELGHEPPPAELLDRALSWAEQNGR